MMNRVTIHFGKYVEVVYTSHPFRIEDKVAWIYTSHMFGEVPFPFTSLESERVK